MIIDKLEGIPVFGKSKYHIDSYEFYACNIFLQKNNKSNCAKRKHSRKMFFSDFSPMKLFSSKNCHSLLYSSHRDFVLTQNMANANAIYDS